MQSDDCDIIVSLLEFPFGRRNEENKNDILNKGRPTPNISCTQTAKKRNRNFKYTWYNKNKWLCGSIYKHSLFCWPCLLVCVKKTVWTNDGFRDWKNLSRGLERHSTSKEHIQNVISVKQLSKQAFTILEQLNEHAKRLKVEYNAKVSKNREVFKRLIDLTCVLCTQDMPFQGPEESSNCSLNKGNFQEFFRVMLNGSKEIKSHWEKMGGFSGLSDTIPNDLVDCIKEELKDNIYNNIRNSSFYSIQIDKITEKAQCSIICNFIDRNGHIKEHLLGFYDVGQDKTAEGICRLIMEILEPFDFKNKLIAQTFDGASVMSSELNDLQARIRSFAPQALITHCFAHHLNLVLQHSCCNISSVRIFFANLQGIPAFFKKSTKRAAVLDRIVGKPIINNEVGWNSNAKVIGMILNERMKLIEVFNKLMNFNDSTDKTIRQAEGYKNKLCEFDFVLYLLIFKDIFLKTQVLNDILQKEPMDIQMCLNHLSICLTAIKGMRNDETLQNYIKKTQTETGHILGSNLLMHNSALSCHYLNIFYEIIDNISTQITTRFSNIKSLQFLQLSDSSQFYKFQRAFPEIALTSLMNSFGNFFDKQFLRNELRTIYARENELLFYNSPDVNTLLKRIVENDLHDVLPQAYKLFSLIATIPATKASVERNVSYINCIMKYVRNTMEQEQISHLALISIEKQLLVELMNKSSWYENIINRYAFKKDWKVDLLDNTHKIMSCTTLPVNTIDEPITIFIKKENDILKCESKINIAELQYNALANIKNEDISSDEISLRTSIACHNTMVDETNFESKIENEDIMDDFMDT